MTLDFRTLDRIVMSSKAATLSLNGRTWTREEDQFLTNNLSYITEEEIGLALGRTAVAVRLHWKRDLHLPSPSKAPNVITAHEASQRLGIDAHKTAGWVDMGLLAGRVMAGGRNIRLIDRTLFRRWVLNPMNWMYFDIHKVADPELKRMLKKRAARWGDEWWTTRQVADYHGVDPKDVTRYIKLKRLHSFHLPFALSGRHYDRSWSNHFILKSEAIQVKFYRLGKGNAPKPSQFTPAADRWLLKARDQLHMTFVHIGRTMKIGTEKYNKKTGNAMCNPTISWHYRQLKQTQATNSSTKRRAKS